MIKNYSDKPIHHVTVSELDALTIYSCCQSEVRRRLKGGIAPLRGLDSIIAKFMFIANAVDCAICGIPTLEVINIPQEGDVESGPYTSPEACHEACADEFRRRYEDDGDYEPEGWDEPVVDGPETFDEQGFPLPFIAPQPDQIGGGEMNRYLARIERNGVVG